MNRRVSTERHVCLTNEPDPCQSVSLPPVSVDFELNNSVGDLKDVEGCYYAPSEEVSNPNLHEESKEGDHSVFVEHSSMQTSRLDHAEDDQPNTS